MKSVTLGRTGIAVVNAPFGAMYLGTKQDRTESFALLDHYVGRGGNFIDTANIYAHWVGPQWRGGESETLLGEWLKARGNRNQLVIASKVGFGYDDVPTGLTPALIKAECEKSLRRLGVDTIDLYFAHVDDLSVPAAESLGAFSELMQAGKIRSIGASNFTTWRLAEANLVAEASGLPRYEVLQPRHTYLRPRHDADFGPQLPLTPDMSLYCGAHGISIMPYSSGLSGAFTGDPNRPLPAQYVSADNTLRLAAIAKLATEMGVSAHQIVFAWLVAKGTLPLVAASSIAQLDETLDGVELALSPEQVAALDAAGE